MKGSTDSNMASQSDAGTVVAIMSTMLGLATVTVAARFYTRLVIIKQLGADDWAVAVSWLFTLGVGITAIVATKYGLGRHTSTLDPETFAGFLQCLYALIIIYNFALGAVKASFLLQYRRVFGVSRMLLLCNIGLGIVVLWSLLQVFLTAFFCSPPSGFWDITGKSKCLPELPFWYMNAAVNIFTDLMILILPLPALSKLKLGRTQKYVLTGLFSLGFFTCAISIIRIQTLKSAATSRDPTWENVAAACYSIAETTCGTICISVPTLRPLLAKALPQISSLQSNRATTGGYQRHLETNESRTALQQRKGDCELGQFDMNTSPLPEQKKADIMASGTTCRVEKS